MMITPSPSGDPNIVGIITCIGASGVLKTVQQYEDAGNARVCAKISIIHENIIVLDVTTYSSNESVAFTSLSLWEIGDCYYVSDMQDGKVSGFEIYPLQDNIKTPAEFIEHILHDLFYGW